MLGKTHVLFGILCIALSVKYLPIDNLFLYSAFLLIGTLIVDIDSAKSKAGRKIWPLSAIIQFFLKHRGILHTIWIPLLFYHFVKPVSPDIALGFAVGYISHLFLDTLTVQGLNLFYPIKYKVRGFMKTGGFIEEIVQLCIVGGIIISLL
jgi:inner membrane protein